MEGDALYRELQRHLDRMPVAFPATQSGVDIRVLKHLFTPEEVRVALCLSAIPEPLKTIHRRIRHKMRREQLSEILDRMAEKGTVNKVLRKGVAQYGKLPLVLGMYEYQVNRLTPVFARDVQIYLEEGFGPQALLTERTPQMRTVPIHKAIDVERAVASYNDIRKYVEASPGPFAALNCICRQGKDLTGAPCRQTKQRQNCLMLGEMAAKTIAKGVARAVSKEEMLGLLEEADREGLVLEPQNTQEPAFVCCCCGCCCGVLTSAKRMPRPADFFQTDFVARVDGSLCQACGTCETRCQMEAILVGDGEPRKVVEERCIGCGLCVTTCPSGAVQLHRRDARQPPPKSEQALYTQLFQERYGRLGATLAVAGRLMGRRF